MASSAMSATLSQLSAGRRSAAPASSSRAAQPARLVVRSFMGGPQRYGPRQQQQRGARRSQAFGSQGACGSQQFGGMGPMGFGMNITPADVQRMVQEFEKMMSGPSANGRPFENAAASAAGALSVPVDVAEEAETYTFTADLPGVSRADTKVQANKEKRTLTISGNRKAPELSEEQKQRRRRTERRFGQFQRTFNLPKDADLSNVKASFKDGVLAVRVRRTAPAEPEVRDISIDDWFDAGTQA